MCRYSADRTIVINITTITFIIFITLLLLSLMAVVVVVELMNAAEKREESVSLGGQSCWP
jgi:hypothetical protein